MVAYILMGVFYYYIFKIGTEEKDKGFLVFISTIWPITLLAILVAIPIEITTEKIKKIKRNLGKVIPPTVFCKTSNDY